MIIALFCLATGTLAFAHGQASKSGMLRKISVLLLSISAVASLTPIMIRHFANPDHLTTSFGLILTGLFGGFALVVYHCMRKNGTPHTFPWSLRVGIGMVAAASIYGLTEGFLFAMNNPMPTIQ